MTEFWNFQTFSECSVSNGNLTYETVCSVHKKGCDLMSAVFVMIITTRLKIELLL